MTRNITFYSAPFSAGRKFDHLLNIPLQASREIDHKTQHVGKTAKNSVKPSVVKSSRNAFKNLPKFRIKEIAELNTSPYEKFPPHSLNGAFFFTSWKDNGVESVSY